MKKILFFILVFSFNTFAQNYQWESIPANICYNLYSISIVDENTVWLGGKFGFVVKTTDGGKNWHVYRPTDRTIYNIFASSENKCFAAGSKDDKAQIFLTIDSGENWDNVYEIEADNAFINFVYMFDEMNGYLEGDPVNGKFLLLKTKDGGRSWQNAASVPAKEGQVGYNNSMCWVGKYGWFGSNDSSIYLTKDQGETWKKISVKLKNVYEISFTDSLNGFLCGSDTVLYSSNDGGMSWQKVQIPNLYYYPIGITMIDKYDIWYASGDKIYHSSDTGNSWGMVYEATNLIYYMQIKKIGNKLAGWAVGKNGLVLRLKQK